MNAQEVKPVVEALLMVADQPLSLDRLVKLLQNDTGSKPSRELLRETLQAITDDYAERGVELVEVASGFRFRTRAAYAEQIGRLWEERRPRYSRAFMETLAIIAYRQPITRGEIEHIRGVAVSSNIMRQMLEREWVRVVGHRDVPGRPSVYATTQAFLDYFGLRSLEEMPTLADLKDIDDINPDLFAQMGEAAQAESVGEPDSAVEAATTAEDGADTERVEADHPTGLAVVDDVDDVDTSAAAG